MLRALWAMPCERSNRATALFVAEPIDSGANLIFGGQIFGEPSRLFLVYSEGNFIEVPSARVGR